MEGGVKSSRGTDNHGVEELPQEDETSRVIFEGNGVPGTDRRGQVGDGNSSATQYNKGGHRSHPRRGDGERSGAGAAAKLTAGNVRGRERICDYAKAFRRRQRHQAQVGRARELRVRLTGAGGGGGRPSRRGGPGYWGRPQGHHGYRRHRQVGDGDREAARGSVESTPQMAART